MNAGTSARFRACMIGLSLVELMVSLAVGLFIVAGVVHVLQSNKQSYAVQNALSRLQEEGRFALEEITRLVGMAGYDDPANVTAPAVPSIEGTEDPDTVTINFEGGPGINDCLGAPSAANTAVSAVVAVDAAGDLVCTAGGGAATRIAQGVENLQVLYGLDLDGDGVPNQYFTATGVAGRWNQVVTARIGLLLRTPDGLAAAADTATYTVLDNLFDPINDRRLRRIFSTTVRVRN
jgi:type IV pilus assembly protein PilW